MYYSKEEVGTVYLSVFLYCDRLTCRYSILCLCVFDEKEEKGGIENNNNNNNNKALYKEDE